MDFQERVGPSHRNGARWQIAPTSVAPAKSGPVVLGASSSPFDPKQPSDVVATRAPDVVVFET